MEYKQIMPWYKLSYLNYPFKLKESDHYTFHFPEEIEKDIEDIINAKEKHYAKAVSFIGVDNKRKIDYYIYTSIKEKSLLMGDDSPGNAIWEKLDNGISKKFEIHVVYNEKCKFIGEHEDTHLLSLPWGLSIYLFCEGLAQYMECSFLGKSLDVASKELIKNKRNYSISFLCDNSNWDNIDSVVVYPQVGSFIKFLIACYGKDRFRQVYQSTSRNNSIDKNLFEINKVYGKSINNLEEEWIRSFFK